MLVLVLRFFAGCDSGDKSASSPEQNPEETGDSLSILSPMEHLGDKGVLADSPSEDLGETLISN